VCRFVTLFESVMPKMKKIYFSVFFIIFILVRTLPWNFVWCFTMLLESLMQKIKRIYPWNSELCICAPKTVERIDSSRLEKVIYRLERVNYRLDYTACTCRCFFFQSLISFWQKKYYSILQLRTCTEIFEFSIITLFIYGLVTGPPV